MTCLVPKRIAGPCLDIFRQMRCYNNIIFIQDGSDVTEIVRYYTYRSQWRAENRIGYDIAYAMTMRSVSIY